LKRASDDARIPLRDLFYFCVLGSFFAFGILKKKKKIQATASRLSVSAFRPPHFWAQKSEALGTQIVCTYFDFEMRKSAKE